MTRPPVPKYRYTLTIDANSHDEIEQELHMLANGGHTNDSSGYSRDAFDIIGGRVNRRLDHSNPDMTAEQYRVELHEWWLTLRKRAVDPTARDTA